MEADEILQHMGGYGRFQALVFLALCFIYMRGAWPVMAILYLGGDPGHNCKIPVNSTMNESIPGSMVDGVWTYETCKMFVPGTGQNETQSCQNGWSYGDEFQSTILSDWDLVCDNDYLVDTSTTVYMVGNALGAVLLTSLSDRFGRKNVMLIMLWIQGVIGFGTAFANSYILFTVLRFFIALLNMPIALIVYVMMTEVFPSKLRAKPSVGVNCFWGIGLIVLALMGYYIRSWRVLQMVISLPNLLTICYFWFLPESIPWLVAKGRYAKVEVVARLAAKINNIQLPSNLFVAQHTEGDVELEQAPATRTGAATVTTVSQEGLIVGLAGMVTPKQKYTVLDLFKTPAIRRYTLIMFYIWLANSLSYFGILFATPTLHGNQFLNLGISGAVEIPALFICMFALEVVGRKKPLIAFFFLCGTMNIATIFVPATTESGVDLSPLIITLAMLGKFGITGSYSVSYLYSSEIFPTVVRNHALGLSSFFENVGGIAAPFIVYGTTKSTQYLPLVVFGVLTIVAGILTFFLPETHQRPLPETIEEVESMKYTSPTSPRTAQTTHL